MTLLVLCPTRGRPQNAVELLKAFQETHTQLDTHLLMVVDDDDPQRDEYLDVLPPENVEVSETTGNMVIALNASACEHARLGVYDLIGFVGDDHRPRTRGWDRYFDRVLAEHGGGFAYGNDLFQGARLPTHVVMSASIIRALGWMAPPPFTHLYVDDAWRFLGESVDHLFYLPDVVVEHLHPLAGKAEWDAGYERVNAQEMYDRDASEFHHWLKNGATDDVAKVRVALGL